MQIPTGILADGWGPRQLLTLGALVAAIGTVMFVLAPSLTWAAVGRLLIGGSVSVAFVYLLKLAASWFPPHRFAMVSGLALFCGIGGIPLSDDAAGSFTDPCGHINFSTVSSLCVGRAIFRLAVRQDEKS